MLKATKVHKVILVSKDLQVLVHRVFKVVKVYKVILVFKVSLVKVHRVSKVLRLLKVSKGNVVSKVLKVLRVSVLKVELQTSRTFMNLHYRIHRYS